MVRQTSIEAYNQIREEGLLSDLRLVVYEYLYRNGPATAGELMQKYRNQRPDATVTMTMNMVRRLSELQELGVVYEVMRRPCEVTGRNCIVWDVTSGIPIEPEKKKSKDQIIAEQSRTIAQLRVELDECRRRSGTKWKNGELFHD